MHEGMAHNQAVEPLAQVENNNLNTFLPLLHSPGVRRSSRVCSRLEAGPCRWVRAECGAGLAGGSGQSVGQALQVGQGRVWGRPCRWVIQGRV